MSAGKYRFPLYLMRGEGLTRKDYDELKEHAENITLLEQQLAETGTNIRQFFFYFMRPLLNEWNDLSI